MRYNNGKQQARRTSALSRLYKNKQDYLKVMDECERNIKIARTSEVQESLTYTLKCIETKLGKTMTTIANTEAKLVTLN